MPFSIDHIDHLVLTVTDVTATCEFYKRVLGMEIVSFQGGRKALRFGNQKLNLHQHGAEFEPKAINPTPGAIDLCFITLTPIPQVIAHLKAEDVPIEAGPVHRTGAIAPLESIYIRDLDGNLIEIANARA